MIVAISLITTTYALKPSQSQSESKEKSPEAPLYTISEFNGRLAVFNYNSDIPIEIYDIKINTLPILDYEKIKTGVNVYTKESLYILIEEYTS